MQFAPGVEMDASQPAICAEELARADIYAMLATMLSAEPTADTLDAVARLEAPPTGLGERILDWARTARDSDLEDVRSAYFDLFIGVGRGLLVPYGSYYLTGFLNEKPLAKLRQDMARLGIEREPGVVDPEDHISSVLEIMSGIIRGDFEVAGEAREATAQAFFEKHIAPWARVFFTDLANTGVSPFYTALGRLGADFMALEDRALDYT